VLWMYLRFLGFPSETVEYLETFDAFDLEESRDLDLDLEDSMFDLFEAGLLPSLILILDC
jgi:hypothetical protein